MQILSWYSYCACIFDLIFLDCWRSGTPPPDLLSTLKFPPIISCSTSYFFNVIESLPPSPNQIQHRPRPPFPLLTLKFPCLIISSGASLGWLYYSFLYPFLLLLQSSSFFSLFYIILLVYHTKWARMAAESNYDYLFKVSSMSWVKIFNPKRFRSRMLTATQSLSLHLSFQLYMT